METCFLIEDVNALLAWPSVYLAQLGLCFPNPFSTWCWLRRSPKRNQPEAGKQNREVAVTLCRSHKGSGLSSSSWPLANSAQAHPRPVAAAAHTAYQHWAPTCRGTTSCMPEHLQSGNLSVTRGVATSSALCLHAPKTNPLFLSTRLDPPLSFCGVWSWFPNTDAHTHHVYAQFSMALNLQMGSYSINFSDVQIFNFVVGCYPCWCMITIAIHDHFKKSKLNTSRPVCYFNKEKAKF